MEAFEPALDVDDLLLGALEPDDIHDDLDHGRESPDFPGASLGDVRRAMLIEDARSRPRAKLEVSFLGPLGRVEAKLIRADGTTRIVRASSLGTCLAVMNDVADVDGGEMELDDEDEWVCPECHGLRVRLRTREVGGARRGELGLCPSCSTETDGDNDDEPDDRMGAPREVAPD